MPKNIKATERLKIVLDKSFNAEEAITLVRQNADPNITSSSGLTLLHRLAHNNSDGKHSAIIDELINKHNVDVDIRSSAGLTPLQYLCLNLTMNWPATATSTTKSTLTAAIKQLVVLGAEIDIKGYLAPLHIIARSNIHDNLDELRDELINDYNADIDILNGEGFTLLQNSLHQHDIEKAMKLVHLGADTHQTNANGLTLSQILKAENIEGRYEHLIKDLDNLSIKFSKQGNHERRNEFLTCLLILINDTSNTKSQSYFKHLPLELFFYIFKFFDFNAMRKTSEEGVNLAKEMYQQYSEIKKILPDPGGMNVFQIKDILSNKPTFTFFKSAKILCLDYNILKSNLQKTQCHKNPILDKLMKKEFTNSSMNKINDFKKYAREHCLNHFELYKKPKNKLILWKSISDTELYKNHEIKYRLRIS